MKSLILSAEPCDDRIEVVRVAVMNNFNCTEEEFAQLDAFRATAQAKNPHRSFFINTNVKTPRLLAINDHPYKAVITLNPNLTVEPRLVDRLYEIDYGKVAFVRVKYLPRDVSIRGLLEALHVDRYNVVVTPQRFVRETTLLKYSTREFYEHTHSRFRLTPAAFAELERIVDGLAPTTYICDHKEVGCGGCGLCASLTMGRPGKVMSLNLSTSGECHHTCPDCYARELYGLNKARGNNPVYYDKTYRNDKQTGRTKHILDAQAALS